MIDQLQDIRTLKTGDLFKLPGGTTTYVYRGNGWYDARGGGLGGPWHTYGMDVIPLNQAASD